MHVCVRTAPTGQCTFCTTQFLQSSPMSRRKTKCSTCTQTRQTSKTLLAVAFAAHRKIFAGKTLVVAHCIKLNDCVVGVCGLLPVQMHASGTPWARCFPQVRRRLINGLNALLATERVALERRIPARNGKDLGILSIGALTMRRLDAATWNVSIAAALTQSLLAHPQTQNTHIHSSIMRCNRSDAAAAARCTFFESKSD